MADCVCTKETVLEMLEIRGDHGAESEAVEQLRELVIDFINGLSTG